VSAPLASPVVRRRAREFGVALEELSGSGPGGRVIEQDVDRYAGRAAAKRFSAAAEQGTVREIKIIGLRRKIAEKMQESKRRIPHFTYVEEFDLTALETLRGQLNAKREGDQPKLTLLPFFMRALVRLVPVFPTINSRYDDENGVLRPYSSLHIGIAT
jgi:2-oxoisovalerate dehydrogenase E2 component (dihydrolipoyl transacylase)